MKKTMGQNASSSEECNLKGDGKEEFKKLSEEERERVKNTIDYLLDEKEKYEALHYTISLLEAFLREA